MVSLPGFENVKRDINTICLARISGTCLAAVLHKGEKKWPDTARRHNKGQGGDARAETRNSEERPVGKESDQPQAGDSHRTVEGAKSRC